MLTATGDVSLWTKDTTAKASAGSLVGTFKKNSRWNLNSASTFDTRVCLTAVKDAEVARKAELENRSAYPTTGVRLDDFLPAEPMLVDGMNSKSTLRGLIRGGGSRAARRGALQPGSSAGSLATTAMTASGASLVTTGAMTARLDWPSASDIADWPSASDIADVRPMTTGGAPMQSARTAVERTPQLPPYPLPRMPHGMHNPGSRMKTPRYNVHPVAMPPSEQRPMTSGVHTGFSNSPHSRAVPGGMVGASGGGSSGRGLGGPVPTRAQQILEAAGLGGLRPTATPRTPSAQGGRRSGMASPRALQLVPPSGRPMTVGATDRRPTSPNTFAMSITPTSTAINYNKAKEKDNAAKKGGGGSSGSRGRPQMSADKAGVFKYKRLDTYEASYEKLTTQPKIHRSDRADAIFKDTHNVLSLTSNRQKRGVRG